MLATSRSPIRPPKGDPPRQGHAIKRITLLALIAVCVVNSLIGAPLLALWVGSQIVGASGQLTLTAVAGILATFLAVETILIRVLEALIRVEARLIGRSTTRPRAAWLRSMSDSAPHATDAERHITASDAVLIITVVTAVIAFEIWFFVFAHATVLLG